MFVIRTVRIPTIINVIVAIIDLKENRLMPLIPCPLVQPLLNLVPKPTNTPPAVNKGNELEINILISLPNKNVQIKGPNINPTKNNKFSIFLSFEIKKLLAIPLTPIMLPLSIKNKITDRPINNPPVNADTGVKLIIFI